MRIHTLTLRQFRNYADETIDCSVSDVHIFVGPNGSGKTNILEAVSILSLSKSFLTLEEEHLRQWRTEFYRVSARCISEQNEEKEIEVVSQELPRKQKACFINGVRVQGSALVGQLPIVLFLPQDLSLFVGPPAERRRFLDQLLCQVAPEYFAALTDYQKALKQRNALLKRVAAGEANREDLSAWDATLARTGAAVTIARLELMEIFRLSLEGEVESLGERGDIELHYERRGTQCEPAALEAELLTLFAASAERDILLQSTTVGPHRDDWQIRVDDRPLHSFASRGQQRTYVLALLFLQASFLEVRRGEKPVILLDDVLSELDAEHQRRLLSAFRGYQVLMTSAHVPPTVEGGTVWEVKEGAVARAGTAVH
ncbi:MAG: DNA replication/repair protein RecF [Candidatus Peregrinibacteria bacterium]|nr:DNA replication/repair protein RecF [Candidatus Peregrinibacteria bacterium]